MCNLYRVNETVTEIARLFGATAPAPTNAGGEVFPGQPGIVVAHGRVANMVWGFPLPRTSARTGKPIAPRPVNNARADKLGSAFWKDSFAHRRCLVPMTAFAEAEGAPGRKTRSWVAPADHGPFACAGIWRETLIWGAVYSLVMTDAAEQMDGLHDRMPVILDPESYSVWQTGSDDAARALCRPWPGSLTIDRTAQRWC